MPFRAPPWQRPLFEAGGDPASVMIFVFLSERPAPVTEQDNPMSLYDWAPWDVWPAEITCDARPRDANPGFFQGFAELARKPGAAEAPFPEELLKQLDVAPWCAAVTCKADDPPDLGYLQFSWAIVRWLFDHGGFFVVDHAAMRLWSREQVLAWQPLGWPGGRHFKLEREIRITVADGMGPNDPPLLVTSGMEKFGRPELIVPLVAAWVEEALQRTCSELALGKRLEPGAELLFGSERLAVALHQPGVNSPDLGIPGPALVLTPSGPRS